MRHIGPIVIGGLVGFLAPLAGYTIYTWQFWVIILVTVMAVALMGMKR